MISKNPYTGEIVQIFKADSKPMLDEKLSLLNDAFVIYRNSYFTERTALLLEIADKLLLRKADLAECITTEMGKLSAEAVAEIEKCALNCRFYAENGAAMLSPELIEESDSIKKYKAYHPMGVVLLIMPWNFPFWQVFRCAAPILMAGNTIALKHASNVPKCALLIEEIINSAAEKVFKTQLKLFSTLLIGAAEVESAIAHPAVQGISLTGSEAAGASVASIAGKYLKKTVLELGGNDPFVILPDAKNLEHIASEAIKARMINGGQSCIASKRFFVPRVMYAEFVAHLKKGLNGLKFGNPSDSQTTWQGLAKIEFVDELQSQVDGLVKIGAEVIYQHFSNDLNAKNAFPIIILNMDNVPYPEGDVELFGPVFQVFTYDITAEMLDKVNASKYALGASVWGSDIQAATEIAEQIIAGAKFINSRVISEPMLPFGGAKLSGYGRELSSEGLKEFSILSAYSVHKK